jgi:ACT domain-containing protein
VLGRNHKVITVDQRAHLQSFSIDLLMFKATIKKIIKFIRKIEFVRKNKQNNRM